MCTFYLGKDRTRRDCQNSSEPFVGENSMKNGSFLHVPLQRQLKNLLMDTEIHAKLTNHNLENITQSSIISDVTSSMLYRQLIQHHHLSCNDISITWNADGVPIFKSSKYSIWPIQCMVNELPPSTVKECSAYRSVVWPQQTWNEYIFEAICKRMPTAGGNWFPVQGWTSVQESFQHDMLCW